MGFCPVRAQEIALNNGTGNAQKAVFGPDTLKVLDVPEVVVSATRSERDAATLPLPVTVIRKEQIEAMGSQRLSEVLAEQTGLTLSTDHGTGLQLQGFDPDYTLILIDGEPLIGRTAGTLDLTRLSVANIERIEIIKGPASSLYGSEAMGGVVNIITKTPKRGIETQVKSRFGSNTTHNQSVQASGGSGRVQGSLYYDHYQTAGYSLAPESGSPTVAPFTNHTAQARLTLAPADNHTLDISGRFFDEQARASYRSIFNQDTANLSEKSSQRDENLAVTYRPVFGNLRPRARLYYSGYETRSTIVENPSGELYDESYFRQRFLRPELQLEWRQSHRLSLLGGIGYIGESVEATRYTALKRFDTWYGFFQAEFRPTERLNLMAGGRYDHQSVYGQQLSPKVSSSYKINKVLTAKVSVGSGFKAPDFRYLYLDFSNPVAGYSVFGTEEVVQRLTQLRALGQLDTTQALAPTTGSIKAETSLAYNLGFDFQPIPQLTVTVNGFYNRVKNLIETMVVARKANGQNVFSYGNLNRIYTRGVELEATARPASWANLSVGYQYLEAADEAVLEGIRKGQYFARDANLNAYKLTRRDYGGLMNRSRHMANAKLFLAHARTGWSGNLRVVYRGRYGFMDRNGNTILDADNEYVKGFATLNLSLGKTFFNQLLAFQAGCDNILNTRRDQVSTMPGRLFWVSAAIQLRRQPDSQSPQN